MITQRGVHHALHYLDDFLIAGLPDSAGCALSLQTALSTCYTLEIPVAPEKTVGPATTLTFLGLQLDTLQREISLPQHKLAILKEELITWLHWRACTKWEL